MAYRDITIKDIEPIIPFSRGSTEIFLTGQWSAGKPAWVEKTSPCRQGCPIGNDIARAFALASKGRNDEALAVFREENPLPGVCGRVCYHPCEPACNRKEMDSAINIRGFERFLADQGHVALPRPAAVRKEKVAIIGSGPAGLSAAYHLARLGFHVTVFEALPEAGGMLMYGIPEYRLPKAVLRREIGRLVRLGVSIETNARIAAEGESSLLAFPDVRRDYDAVFLAVGSHKGAGLGVENEAAKGVMEGIAFLRSVGMKEATGLGKRVAVIGGGNTAVDCARTAKRLGAKDVTVLYRRSKAEMPALAEDVEGMEGDGIKMELLAAPKRVVADGGRMKAIECVRMTLGAPDAGGRATPVPIPGSEFIVPVDTVIAAVGQAPELDFISGSGVAASARGMIGIDAMGATGVPGVFAGGDAAGTRAFVADAIASGKLGALAIYCYIEGKDAAREYEALRIGRGPAFAFGPLVHPEKPKVDLTDVVTYDRLNTISVPFAKRNDNPKATNGARGDDAFAELAGGLTRKKAEAEISRCFKCGLYGVRPLLPALPGRLHP